MDETKKKKTWNDFSSGQKAAMIVLGLIQVALLIAAQRDIGQTARLGDQRFKGDVAGAGLRQLGRTDLLVRLWSQALSASGAHQRQHLVYDVGCGDRGDVGVVVGGCHLDHVRTHEIDAA